MVPTARQPHGQFHGLEHEYALAEDLDSAWTRRSRALIRDGARTALLLEDPAGCCSVPAGSDSMELQILRLAIGVAAVLGKGLDERGLVHREIKPANMLVKGGGEEVRLTGFGIASRLPRERQSPEPIDDFPLGEHDMPDRLLIGRIRALVTKAPPRKDSVEINAAIREVVELTRSEAVKNGVSVRTDLAEGLP